MAATYGRLTGKPGVCISTLGPGALNLTTARVCFAGRHAHDHDHRQKGILSSRQLASRCGCVATMKPLTKLSRQIVSAGMIPTLVREAFRVAEEERPGPCTWSFPEDIAAETCEHVALVAPHPWNCRWREAGARSRAQLIIRAERPLACWRSRLPTALDRRHRTVRAAHPDTLFHHANGKARCPAVPNCTWGLPRSRKGLRARGDRSRRPHHHDRS